MINGVNYLKLISNSFDKLHDQLSILRAHIEKVNDPEAEKLLKELELGLLAPMRRLRQRLEIPYDWHEIKEEAEQK